MPENDRTIFEVCRYLCQDRPPTQKQIAGRLGLSEKRVSQLASEAKAAGYLRKVFHPPGDEKLGLELARKFAHFGIRGAVVVGHADSVGYAAARFFEHSARSGQTVVLDGGKTVGAFVEALTNHVFERMTIIPICADPASYDIAAYELVTRMAVKYPARARCERLPYWHGADLDAIHRRICRRAGRANFVVLGAGPWRHRYTALDFVRHLGLNVEAIFKQYSDKVCGVVGHCAVTDSGAHIALAEVDERLPRSLEFGDLQRMSRSSRCHCLLLAAGARKLEVVTAALKAHLVNTLMVDRDLGTRLLSKAD